LIPAGDEDSVGPAQFLQQGGVGGIGGLHEVQEVNIDRTDAFHRLAVGLGGAVGVIGGAGDEAQSSPGSTADFHEATQDLAIVDTVLCTADHQQASPWGALWQSPRLSHRGRRGRTWRCAARHQQGCCAKACGGTNAQGFDEPPALRLWTGRLVKVLACCHRPILSAPA
jgi:hypothetical protein